MKRDELSLDADFREALILAGVLDLFLSLSPSHKREHIEAINDAKKPSTRLNRIRNAVEMIKSRN